MQGDYILILTLIFSLLLFIIQRVEAKYRRMITILIVLTAGILIRRYVIYREVETEALIALAISLVINFLFWLLIGRYNPVGDTDKGIQVLGMDD